jgi:hypothetical protein
MNGSMPSRPGPLRPPPPAPSGDPINGGNGEVIITYNAPVITGLNPDRGFQSRPRRVSGDTYR